jgi:hypothetical protein
MIVKILGAMDILTGLLFWLFGILGFGSKELILLLGMVLLIKGIVFIYGFSLISFFDIIIGLVIMSSGGGVVMPKVVVIIVCLFLLQKGAFSMVS